MSGIAEILAQRTRGAAATAQTGKFRLARGRAIQKMRDFALPDPHQYILELVQAALANGAESLYLQFDDREAELSYVGGAYRKEELAQLFDYLFASKDRLEHARLRDLAMGLNAAFAFEPRRVVIETGDGTATGSVRLTMGPGGAPFDVTAAGTAITGTSIRLEGLTANAGSARLRERRLVEERCLMTPVTIAVNGELVSGYAPPDARRTLGLWGYRTHTSIDEGDLFGSIGFGSSPGVRLLIRGVWIQTVEHPDAPSLMGVISYDRLRKTADHAGIVRDERFTELLKRLDPYVRRLRGERTGTPGQFEVLGADRDRSPQQLRSYLSAQSTVLCVPGVGHVSAGALARIEELGRQLRAPVVTTTGASALPLEILAGARGVVWVPDRTDPTPAGGPHAELRFAARPLAEPPARPWLAEPVSVTALPLVQIAGSAVVAADDGSPHTRHGVSADRLLRRFVSSEGTARVDVFAPERPRSSAEGVDARVLTLGRVVWEGRLPTTHRGLAMDVHLPAVSPLGLLEEIGREPAAYWWARGAAGACGALFTQAGERAARAVGAGIVRPGTMSAIHALDALSRNVRWSCGPVEPGGAWVSDWTALAPLHGLATAPVLQTRAGRSVDLQGLGALLAHGKGAIYAARHDVVLPAELSPDAVIEARAVEVRALRALLGAERVVEVKEASSVDMARVVPAPPAVERDALAFVVERNDAQATGYAGLVASGDGPASPGVAADLLVGTAEGWSAGAAAGLSDAARLAGVAGAIRVHEGDAAEVVDTLVEEVLDAACAALANEAAGADGAAAPVELALSALLRFATAHLSVPPGARSAEALEVSHPLAMRAVRLPLVQGLDGRWVAPIRVLDQVLRDPDPERALRAIVEAQAAGPVRVFLAAWMGGVVSGGAVAGGDPAAATTTPSTRPVGGQRPRPSGGDPTPPTASQHRWWDTFEQWLCDAFGAVLGYHGVRHVFAHHGPRRALPVEFNALSGTVTFNLDAPAVADDIERAVAGDRVAHAALALRACGALNAELDAVTNVDELAFHTLVFDALLDAHSPRSV